METKNLHKDHRERLRERALKDGMDVFQDHELLELLLGYAIGRKNTNPLAHRLLARFGSFRGLLEAPLDELKSIPEMGEYSAWFIRLLGDLVRRHHMEFIEGSMKLDTPEARLAYFMPFFISRAEETLFACFLNGDYEVLRTELQYVGSINAVEIHAHRVLKTAKELSRCRYVVLAHNHFHSVNPSLQDYSATRKVYRQLKAQGYTLLDHVIISGNRGKSMAETGHLKKIQEEYEQEL